MCTLLSLKRKKIERIRDQQSTPQHRLLKYDSHSLARYAYIHAKETRARSLSLCISHALLITHMKCTRFGARSRFFAAISNNQSKSNQYDDENRKLHAWRLLYFTLILRMSIATHMECCMLYLLMCAMAQISKTFLQRRQNKRRPIFTLRFVFTSLCSTLSQICRIVSTQRFLISSVHHCNDIVCWVLFFFWLFSMILWFASMPYLFDSMENIWFQQQLGWHFKQNRLMESVAEMDAHKQNVCKEQCTYMLDLVDDGRCVYALFPIDVSGKKK